MDDTRTCPYCGEAIRREATVCRFCRSRLAGLDPERWHRDRPERRLAGVAAAVARALAVPVGTVRLGFILLSFFHLLGPVLYGALWLIVPFAPGGESPLAVALARAREIAGALRGAGGSRASAAPGSGGVEGAAGASGGAATASVPEGPRPC
jgi:phage shock protein PspC (stress-responsive transcriptional regulator)